MKQKKSGFTLLELLIVVAILAVLVALAMPFFQDYLNRSRITAAEADLTSFQKALASYDQLESEMFTTGNVWTDLIGKYLQDFRSVPTQAAPLDPWGYAYVIDIDEGTILSVGPNGTNESTGRVVAGDDLMKTWKPQFFVVEARKVSTTEIEVTFSRKIKTIAFGNLTQTGAAGAVTTAIQKMSDTVYRFTFDLTIAAATSVTITDNTVIAQDDKPLLAADKKPDNTTAANVFTF